jgi:predicted nuclease of predicted toxin-antitoxin system
VSGDQERGIKILIDEDVSAWVAHRLRVDQHIYAIHVRDRGHLGSTDREVLELAFIEDRILITANVSDFERLAQATEIHPGIVVVLDGALRRSQQLTLLRKVIGILESEAVAGRDMLNRVLRVSADGTAEFFAFPEPES